MTSLNISLRPLLSVEMTQGTGPRANHAQVRELFSRWDEVGGCADAVLLDGVFGYVVHNRGEVERRDEAFLSLAFVRPDDFEDFVLLRHPRIELKFHFESVLRDGVEVWGRIRPRLGTLALGQSRHEPRRDIPIIDPYIEIPGLHIHPGEVAGEPLPRDALGSMDCDFLRLGVQLRQLAVEGHCHCLVVVVLDVSKGLAGDMRPEEVGEGVLPGKGGLEFRPQAQTLVAEPREHLVPHRAHIRAILGQPDRDVFDDAVLFVLGQAVPVVGIRQLDVIPGRLSELERELRRLFLHPVGEVLVEVCRPVGGLSRVRQVDMAGLAGIDNSFLLAPAAAVAVFADVAGVLEHRADGRTCVPAYANPRQRLDALALHTAAAPATADCQGKQTQQTRNNNILHSAPAQVSHLFYAAFTKPRFPIQQ